MKKKTRPMRPRKKSIFKRYYSRGKFFDRFKKEPNRAIDIIMPLVHTNELWRKNLISIYREIPVNRLLIGDGGCIDDSLDIARKFPRVKIFNHRKFKTLGYSIKKLIEKVETEWFVYLHTDVYLPKNWFNDMCQYRKKYDWFECRQHITVLADYQLNCKKSGRPLSGSQMGRKRAFKKVLPIVKDDYLYRNEDVIFANLIKSKGFRYGKATDVIHYHQVMNKVGPWKRKISDVSLNIEKSREEEERECAMQVKSIVKYLNPKEDYNKDQLVLGLETMRNLGIINQKKFEKWVKKTNPKWLPYIIKKDVETMPKEEKLNFLQRVKALLNRMYSYLKNSF